jgi:hypothetical protein
VRKEWARTSGLLGKKELLVKGNKVMENSDTRPNLLDDVLRLRVQALQQADPLAANLQMMCADLIAHATQVNQALTKESPEGAVTSSGYRAYEKKSDLLLKLARQIDRFAHLQRQQCAAEDGSDVPSLVKSE